MDYLLQKNVFKNPNKLPLNELNLEIKHVKNVKPLEKDQDLEKMKSDLSKYYEVRIEKVMALDKRWIQTNRIYNLYQPYYTELSPDENDSFVINNSKFLECLDFLLQTTYQQFWCYVIFEENVTIMLKSFIYHGVSWYEIRDLNEKCAFVHSQIKEKVLQICARLLCYKESEVEYMSEKTVLQYLQTNKLFTFPVIMQLCLLYKNSNQTITNELISAFISTDKIPIEDLRKMLEQVLLVFEMIGGQVCEFEDNAVLIPIGVDKKPPHFDPNWYEDVAKFLLDTAANLNAFLSVCKEAVSIAYEMGIPYRLSYFYNRVFPGMYRVLKLKRKIDYDWSELKTRIFHYMSLGRVEFVNCFHVFVGSCIDNILQNQGDIVQQDKELERYIMLISNSLEDEFFIFDYHSCNNIDVQLQMITDFYPELDTMRTNYILECLLTLPNLQDMLTVKKISVNTQAESGASTSREITYIPVEEIKKLNVEFTEEEIEVAIRSVLDTLPHLGDGFVLKCLELYNYDPVEVISAILDENLPPSLAFVPHDQIRVPPERDPLIDKTILAYRGKKPTYKDTKDLLDDKTNLQDVKNFVLKTASTPAYDIYDDEYDDRLDEEPRIQFADDSKENPRISMEKHLKEYEVVSDPSESEDEGPKRNPAHFCEDPALVRERREAQRKNSGRGKGRDVVGKPKGQGQDKNVQISREKKNVNKSSRANHNRKGGSQFKRNKGMIPS